MARYTLITLRHAAPHLVPHPMRLATSANGIAAAPTSSSSAPSDPVSPELHQKLLAAIVRLLVGHPPASMAANWPSAAEAAVAAVYALSPNPQEVMAAVLEEMFRRCRPAGASGGCVTDWMLHYFEHRPFEEPTQGSLAVVSEHKSISQLRTAQLVSLHACAAKHIVH